MESASVPWQRQATSARWRAAPARAITDGVSVYKISGSRAGVAYAVPLTDCECEAATRGGDPVCRHRAALAHRLGHLDPEPSVPPAASAVPVCQGPTCQDTGSVVRTSTLFVDQTHRAACPDCRKIVDLRPFLAKKPGGTSAA